MQSTKVFGVLLLILHTVGLGEAALWQHLGTSITKQHKINEKLDELIFKHYPMKWPIRVTMRASNQSTEQVFSDIINTMLSRNKRAQIDLYSGVNVHYQVHLRLFFVDSVQNLRSLVGAVSDKCTYCFVILPPKINDPISEVSKMTAFCWKYHLVFVNFFVEDLNGNVNLYTYFPYNRESCGSTRPVMMNFDEKPVEYGNDLRSREMDDLWKCPLRVIVLGGAPFILLNHTKQGQIEHISGLDGEVLKLLAKTLNFTLDIISLPKQNTHIANISGTLREYKADMAIGNLRCSFKLLNDTSQSDSYYMSSKRIFLRPPSPYTSLELLLIPFDLYTWIIIVVFFFGRHLCRLIYKKYASRVMPADDYHSRMFMIIYLFSFFMVRSAYEGSVFNFLSNGSTKPIPKTMDEAIGFGYKFLIDAESNSYLDVPEKIKSALIVVNNTKISFSEALKVLPGKLGIFILEDYTRLSRNRLGHYVLMNEKVLQNLACVYLPKLSNLLLNVNRKLPQLNAAGLVKKLHEDFVSVETSKNFVEKGPRALGMRELMGVFQLYALLMCLALLVFVLEVTAQKYRRLPFIVEFF